MTWFASSEQISFYSLGEITSDVLRIVGEARAGSLGPFSPSFNIQNVLLASMQRHLPDDVHKIVSGRLHISLTRVYDGKNVIVSDFPTREDLLQVCVFECTIFSLLFKCLFASTISLFIYIYSLLFIYNVCYLSSWELKVKGKRVSK